MTAAYARLPLTTRVAIFFAARPDEYLLDGDLVKKFGVRAPVLDLSMRHLVEQKVVEPRLVNLRRRGAAPRRAWFPGEAVMQGVGS